MPTKSFKEKTKELVVQGKLNEALKLLLENSKEDSEINDIIIQSGRYHDLRKREASGTISPEDYHRDLNKLRRNILNIIDAISVQPDTVSTSKKLKEEYKRSIARISVLQFLYKQEIGSTIKQIQDGTKLKNRRFIIFTLDELIAVEMVERFRENNQSLNKLTAKGRNFVVALDLS